MEDCDFLKYLGGFFDADGSVFWTTQGKLCLDFSQSEKILLDMINERYNGIFGFSASKRTVSDACSVNRTQFTLGKSGKKLYPVLMDLKNTCIIKNPQVHKALEFLNEIGKIGRQEQRDVIGKIIKDMNSDKYNEEYVKLRPYDIITTQYIAGLFDGDGHVGIYNKGVKIHITQTSDTKMLGHIQKIYPGSMLTSGKLYFNRLDLQNRFLSDILPYLIYKHEQVEDALKFLDTDDDELRQRLRENVYNAKRFDMDPEKYTRELHDIFDDLDKNYTKEDLMFGKKLEEISKTRKTISWDNQVFNSLDVHNIKPKLIFCETRDELSKWLYYRKKTSSIYHSGSIGRNMRILVMDEVTGNYIGVMALGSDFYNISARDKYIKNFTDKSIPEYLNFIANLTCCVPLQPFGYNTNGGKLLLRLAFSKEVSDHWMKLYGQPILAICTLGVNGKSVLYDRLKEVKFIGETRGKCSTIHIPKIVIDKARVLYKHLGLKNNRHGTVDMLNTLFKATKMKKSYEAHINKKSIYFGWMYSTKFNDVNPSSNSLKSIETIAEEWKTRWAIKRVKNLRDGGRLKTKVELYEETDEIFKNIKKYLLPEVRNISKNDHVVLKVLPKPNPEPKTPLLLQRLSDEMIVSLMTKKGTMPTEEVSKYIKDTYNIVVPRHEISKLYTGEILPSDYMQNSQEYKDAIQNSVKRVYNKPKSEAWKTAILAANSQRDISEEKTMEIMREKKTAYSAEVCGEGFTFDTGKKSGQKISRTTIQNIWNGKRLPSVISTEYQELLDYTRSRATKY